MYAGDHHIAEIKAMRSLFDISAPWWTFAARGMLTYVGLLVLTRLTGKRSLGEMSAFDLIVLVLVGGTLRTAIIGGDEGFIGPFIGVASIFAADKTLGWACARSTRLNRFIEGLPAVLVRNGRRDDAALKAQSVPSAALDRALHAAGLEDERSIQIGRLEPNGKMTFIRR
jgi:uncharacterized membrane protein YcaP (DUF421 family)